MFRCDLPPALFAKWPESFTCQWGHTGVKQMLNMSENEPTIMVASTSLYCWCCTECATVLPFCAYASLPQWIKTHFVTMSQQLWWPLQVWIANAVWSVHLSFLSLSVYVCPSECGHILWKQVHNHGRLYKFVLLMLCAVSSFSLTVYVCPSECGHTLWEQVHNHGRLYKSALLML